MVSKIEVLFFYQNKVDVLNIGKVFSRNDKMCKFLPLGWDNTDKINILWLSFIEPEYSGVVSVYIENEGSNKTEEGSCVLKHCSIWGTVSP